MLYLIGPDGLVNRGLYIFKKCCGWQCPITRICPSLINGSHISDFVTKSILTGIPHFEPLLVLASCVTVHDKILSPSANTRKILGQLCLPGKKSPSPFGVKCHTFGRIRQNGLCYLYEVLKGFPQMSFSANLYKGQVMINFNVLAGRVAFALVYQNMTLKRQWQ